MLGTKELQEILDLEVVLCVRGLNRIEVELGRESSKNSVLLWH